MPEEPRLADDVDPNKLLVEIVQGLLMAHARLDHMEAALRQTVEKASEKQLSDTKAGRFTEQQHFDELLKSLTVYPKSLELPIMVA